MDGGCPDHAAWQLLHGVLGFGENFEILADGQKVNAVDWVFDGKPMKGWTINPTPQGLRAEIEAGKFGQGHDDQWLAIDQNIVLSLESRG